MVIATSIVGKRWADQTDSPGRAYGGGYLSCAHRLGCAVGRRWGLPWLWGRSGSGLSPGAW